MNTIVRCPRTGRSPMRLARHGMGSVTVVRACARHGVLPRNRGKAPRDGIGHSVYARARVMGSYPEIVAKPNICVTEMPSNAVAVLLRSGRDQPSSWARWTFRRETGSAAYPAPPS
jgi:hypothetical protein